MKNKAIVFMSILKVDKKKSKFFRTKSKAILANHINQGRRYIRLERLETYILANKILL